VERCSLIYELSIGVRPRSQSAVLRRRTIVKGAVIERSSEVFAILRPELFYFITEKNAATII
jgi:hypothetical protein